MNKAMHFYRRLVLCSTFSLLSFFSITAQSLYQEALELSNAIKDNQPRLVIQSDSLVTLEINYGEQKAPTVYKRIQAYPSDSITLTLDTVFSIPYPGTSYTIQLVYDTLRSDTIVVTDTVSVKNYLTNCSISMDTDNYEFGKYNFWRIHSILGANIYADPAKKVNYSFSKAQNIYNSNPYIDKLLPNNLFDIQVGKDSVQSVLKINSEIGILNESQSAEALSLIYVDTALSAQKFLQIKEVVQNYHEPEVTNTQALQSLSNSIQSTQNISQSYDYTTSLITGLADFIAERAQEEFNYSFMSNFEKRLDEIPELGVLFPKTRTFLDNIQLANYKTLLISARTAFTSDLDNLGLNLPKLLTLEKYKSLETNSDIFNLLTIYSMVDLVYRGVAIDTIVPLTYQKFAERRQELGKTTNIVLAKKLFGTPELQEFADSVDQFEQLLVDIKAEIGQKQSSLLRQYNFEIQKVTAINYDPQKIKKINALYQNSVTKINQLYNTKLRMGWDSVAVIPSYLRGTPAYQYILKNPRIENFDKYFSTPPDTVRLIASGLELSRLLVNGYDNNPGKVQVLSDWNNALNQSEIMLNALVATFDIDTVSVLTKAINREDTLRINLQKAVDKDISFWKNAGANQHDIKALEFIAGTLDDFYYADLNALGGPDSLFNVLEARKNAMNDIQTVLKKELFTLYERYKSKTDSTYSPLLDSLTRPVKIVKKKPTKIQQLLSKATDRSINISQQLSTLDKLYCEEYIKARNNANVFAKAMELSSQLMYCLKGDAASGNKWITKDEFNKVMSNPLSRNMYLGLIFQRIGDLDLSSELYSDGVASLVTGIVSGISDINTTIDSIDIKKARKQALQFKDYFPFLKTTVQFVNNVITTPLLVKPSTKKNDLGTRAAVSLTQEYSALSNVPEISTNSVAIFENLNKKEYGQAIASFVNLFEAIAKSVGPNCNSLKANLNPQQRKACEEKSNTLRKILKYGTFISDIAVAQTAADIESAFSNASAPIGSSQVKRKNSFDIAINSYFGLAVGRENLDALNENQLFPFNSISLTAPIGFSFSKKLNPNHSGSWTIFLSALDLGAVTAFRLNSPNANLPELNFQNIIAPGGFLFYNIGNSPFSVGAGWQYGPLLRKIEVNGQTISTNASRILFSFTIDVPLFGIYTSDD